MKTITKTKSDLIGSIDMERPQKESDLIFTALGLSKPFIFYKVLRDPVLIRSDSFSMGNDKRINDRAHDLPLQTALQSINHT